MKNIHLTQGAIAIVDDKDYDRLVAMGNWHLSDTGYAVRRGVINGRKQTVRMHRIVNNTPDDMVTDHKNHNRLDNRRSNLRTVTQKENMANYRAKGVSWDGSKGKWMTRYRSTFYGRYLTEREALKAYQLAKSGVPYQKRERRVLFHLPTGVSKQKSSKKYTAKFVYKTKRYYLGTFDTPLEAYSTILNKKKEICQ